MVSNPVACIVGFGCIEDSAGWVEAIVEVGEARAMGGWTMTPAARTSEVVDLVGCEVRLNEVNGERGFDGNFVEEDPAMPVF